jgi:hypothetical protein
VTRDERNRRLAAAKKRYEFPSTAQRLPSVTSALLRSDDPMVNGILDAVADPPKYHGGAGDGIIYVGGGPYWPGIVVGCHMIRRLGCNWPIQVWYRGECEPIDPSQVNDLNVNLIDLDKRSRRAKDWTLPYGNPAVGGWEAKLYALKNTDLARVLYLDADAYPVSMPCRMMGDLNVAPFAYWEDLPNTAGSVNWYTVLPSGASAGIRPVQGGQLLIDRAGAWRLISAAHYICQRSDYYWRGPSPLLFGDQDAWRVGLAADACGHRVLGPAVWKDTAFVCHTQGMPRIVHRTQGKLPPPGVVPGPIWNAVRNHRLPLEDTVMSIYTEVFHVQVP